MTGMGHNRTSPSAVPVAAHFAASKVVTSACVTASLRCRVTPSDQSTRRESGCQQTVVMLEPPKCATTFFVPQSHSSATEFCVMLPIQQYELDCA